MKRMGKKKSNIKESRIVEIEIQQYSDERMNVDNNGAKKNTHTHSPFKDRCQYELENGKRNTNRIE